MSTVYLAEHHLLNQERALKVLSSEFSRQPGFRECFIREGRTVATLRHSNIITIHDIGHCSDGLYMSMEYLNGGSLKDRLESGPLPLEQATQVLSQIGAALQYAHDCGFIHRDIKPANILFNDQGEAVLTDFGISKLQGSKTELTQMGYGLIGTPPYMSPEQTGGQALDSRSDIYSLGLVFYEMLAGKPVIQAKSTTAIIHEHAVSPPPILPDSFAFLQTALNRALKKNPEERYESVQAFVDRVVEQDPADAGTTVVMPSNLNRMPQRLSISDARSYNRQLYRVPFYLFLVTVFIGAAFLWGSFARVKNSNEVNAEATDSSSLTPDQQSSNPAPAIDPSLVEPNTDSPMEWTQIDESTSQMTVRVAPYTILFAEPGKHRLGQLTRNTLVQVSGTVEVKDDGSEWKKVEYDDRAGYVKASHLSAVVVREEFPPY